MTVAFTTAVETPDGPFAIIAGGGAVLASGWTTHTASLVALVHPSLRPVSVVDVSPDSAEIADALRAVDAYYSGDLDAPAKVAVVQESGPFRRHAWDVLRGVAPGAPITYTRYAELAGRPAAVRAAAGACAMNAAALFVPCHRVLRTDGSLGGFRYGLEIKQRLLEREAQGTPVPR